jgi:hypothetical protein
MSFNVQTLSVYYIDFSFNFLALSHFAPLCRGKMRQLPLVGFPRFIANKLFQTLLFLLYISCCESTSHTKVKKKIQIAVPSILQQ